eukprot:Rhum_TRINITY_DN14638_c19_g1::Rhum_TRINITY_DN14638_c19_g1_i1::g.105642::m.105642
MAPTAAAVVLLLSCLLTGSLGVTHTATHHHELYRVRVRLPTLAHPPVSTGDVLASGASHDAATAAPCDGACEGASADGLPAGVAAPPSPPPPTAAVAADGAAGGGAKEPCVRARHTMVSRGRRYECRVLCEQASTGHDAEAEADTAVSLPSSQRGRYLLVIENDLGFAVQYLWKGYDNEEQRYGVGEPGVVREFESYEHHVWVVRRLGEDGQCGAAVAVWHGRGILASRVFVTLSNFLKPVSNVECDPVDSSDGGGGGASPQL